MLKDRDNRQLALDALTYASQLSNIFFRCKYDGNYSGKEDYAVHKEGMPFVDVDTSNWISTPSIPLYIESIFRMVASRDISPEDRGAVSGVFTESVSVLERIANSKFGEQEYRASAKSIHDFTKDVLPKLKEALAGIQEPILA